MSIRSFTVIERETAMKNKRGEIYKELSLMELKFEGGKKKRRKIRKRVRLDGKLGEKIVERLKG